MLIEQVRPSIGLNADCWQHRHRPKSDPVSLAVIRPYRNFAPFMGQPGEWKAQTCAKGIFRQLTKGFVVSESPTS